MFCGSCGAKNEDGAEFCSSCGAKLAVKQAPKQPKTESLESNVNAYEAVSKINPKYIVFGAVAAVIILIIAVVGNNMSHTVNLNNYLSVDFEGYENYGTASYNFDMNGFKEKYAGKMKVKGRANTSQYDGVDEVSYYIGGTLDQYSDLKNGDKVKFTWNIDSSINNITNYKFKFKDETFKVSGLEKVDAFDPFDYINVKFTGISNNGSVQIEDAEGTDGMINYSYFSADNYYGLKEGDVVTVTFYETVEQCIEMFGKVPSSLTKEYTVDGLQEYVASVDKLTETSMAEMINQANDVITAASAGWDSNLSLVNVEYVGCYLLSPKFEYDSNQVICIMKVTECFTNSEGAAYNFEYYYCVNYNSVLIDKDGNITTDLSYYNTAYSSFQREFEEPNSWGGTYKVYVRGFEDLETLEKNEVSTNLSNYKYESNIDESKLISAE